MDPHPYPFHRLLGYSICLAFRQCTGPQQMRRAGHETQLIARICVSECLSRAGGEYSCLSGHAWERDNPVITVKTRFPCIPRRVELLLDRLILPSDNIHLPPAQSLLPLR